MSYVAVDDAGCSTLQGTKYTACQLGYPLLGTELASLFRRRILCESSSEARRDRRNRLDHRRQLHLGDREPCEGQCHGHHL